jgi:hypothetical protein
VTAKTAMLTRIAVALICFASIAQAQPAPGAGAGAGITPESGFISPDKYTSAFFGFSLPLPHGAPLHDLSMPSQSLGAFLYGVQAQDSGLTIFTVTALPSSNLSPDELRKAAAPPKGEGAKRIEIGGKEFWTSATEEHGSAGKRHNLKYVVGLNGYRLEFSVLSFDSKLTKQLEHSIESIQFFDPAKAKEMAGPGSGPYPPPPSEASAPAPLLAKLNLGVVTANLYTNDELGISFGFPPAWTVADQYSQIEPDHLASWEDEKQFKTAQRCTQNLLWVSKYPEGTDAREFNSLITVMATDVDCLKGFKFPDSADDKKLLKSVAHHVMHSFAGAPYVAQSENSVNVINSQGHLLITLMGTSQRDVPGRDDPITTVTCFIFTQIKNYLVAWQFVSGSGDGLKDILGHTTIQFASPAALPQPKPPNPPTSVQH